MFFSLLPQYLINGILAGMVYAVFTSGYSLIFATSRFMHIANGGILSLCGLLTWYFAVTKGVPVVISIFIGIAAAVLVGVFIELFIYRHLRKNGLPFLLTMIVSLGCMTIIQSLLALFLGNNMKYFSSDAMLPSLFIGPVVLPGWQLVSFVISGLLLWLMLYFLDHTRTGSEIQAVASNGEMARLIGINLNKVYLICMIIGTILAAWVGAQEAICHGINAYGGMSFALVGIVVKAIGGPRNTKGIIVMGFIYGLIENLALLFVPAKWASSLAFVIFVVIVLLRATPERMAKEKLGGGL
ncbi:MAG: branched-chain amino acid ABC transporter permease [Anaerovoracaceae bacterium]